MLSLSGWLQAEEPIQERSAQLTLVSTNHEIMIVSENVIQGGFLVDFGITELGFIKRATIGYSNTGTGNIVDIQLGPITGPDATVFSFFSDACSGLTLAPGEQCLFTLDFDPPSVGTFTAGFAIESVGNSDPVTLVGEGAIDEIFDDRFELAVTSTRSQRSQD